MAGLSLGCCAVHLCAPHSRSLPLLLCLAFGLPNLVWLSAPCGSDELGASSGSSGTGPGGWSLKGLQGPASPGGTPKPATPVVRGQVCTFSQCRPAGPTLRLSSVCTKLSGIIPELQVHGVRAWG